MSDTFLRPHKKDQATPIKKNRIAFFIYETRKIDTYPTIVNCAYLLANNNFEVDLFLPEHMTLDLGIANVNVVSVGRLSALKYMTIAEKKARRFGRYSCIFAAFLEGLYPACKLSARSKAPIIYVSMELIYENLDFRLSQNIRRFCIAEYLKKSIISLQKRDITLISTAKALKKCLTDKLTAFGYRSKLRQVSKIPPESILLSIVQDEKRAEFLRREFSFVDKIALLPNSYIGEMRSASTSVRLKYGILPLKKIIIFSGGLEEGFDLRQLKFINHLKDHNYVLFLNVYSRDGYINKLFDYCRAEIENGAIIINNAILPENEYRYLLADSSIGLVWYDNIDKSNYNMYYMGLSSGKLMAYLSAGLPVISTNALYGYQELIEGNGLGFTCSSLEDVPQLVKLLEQNYVMYRSRILKYYEEHLEFSRHFSPIINYIQDTQNNVRSPARTD